MGEDVKLSDADLDRIEYGYVERAEYPPAVGDIKALVAEVRRWRADPWQQDEDGIWRTPDGRDFEEAAEDTNFEPAPLDTGRWVNIDHECWQLEVDGNILELATDRAGARVWSIEPHAGQSVPVAAADLEAAARIIRAEEGEARC